MLGRLIVPGVAGAVALLLGGCGGNSSKSDSTNTTRPSATSATAPSGSTTAQPSTTTGSSQSTVSTSATIHAGGIVVGTAGSVRATMHPASHHPKVEHPWPISFTATRAGRAARASVSYEYLFGGQVVARRSHYTFTGHFSDIFKWPASAVGYPLTFRAVIVSAGVTLNLDYPVQVTR